MRRDLDLLLMQRSLSFEIVSKPAVRYWINIGAYFFRHYIVQERILEVGILRYFWQALARCKWFIETTAMLAVALLLIKFVPFRYWREWLGPIDQKPLFIDRDVNAVEPKAKAIAVSRWVNKTADRFPFAVVCLPRAMAGRWMLLRRGIGGQIFIGTRMNKDASKSEFHAWLMYGDVCLTGQHEKEMFQAFGKRIQTHET